MWKILKNLEILEFANYNGALIDQLYVELQRVKIVG